MAEETKSGRRKLAWQEFDMNALGSAAPAWKAFVSAKEKIAPDLEKLMAPVNEAREALEKAVERQLIADGILAQDQEVRFGYNFGRLAVAFVEAGAGGQGKPKIVLGSKPAPVSTTPAKRR